MKIMAGIQVKNIFLAVPWLLSMATVGWSATMQSSMNSSVTTARVFFDPEWQAYAPALVAPGFAFDVYVISEFTEAQDILLDLLDSEGWYTATRMKVEAGQQLTKLTLQLPLTLQDPSSAYLAVKVLPIDGRWDSYLDQKTIALQWPLIR